MDYCKCSKEPEIATLISEMQMMKANQTEMKDLVIVVTKLVEQLEVTRNDVKTIKEDIQEIKDKPMTAVSKIIYMIVGVIVTVIVNRMLGVM